MATRKTPASRSANDATPQTRTALILQGGGALGAYHVGAYQALQEAGVEPDWIAGISIGAINACILAGNEPALRLQRLETLWNDISRPGDLGGLLQGPLRRAYNQFSYLEALAFGQPHFWRPRLPSPLFVPALAPEQASWCDTSPMRDTLLRLASFERINSGATRLSLGATKVTDGELVFFDSTRDKIGPEHVLASGSLPPGFPATRVGDDLYWDGGCVSNTPLDALYRDPPHGHTRVFMIDLWDAHGPAPTTMDAVAWRAKQIQYASRTAHHIKQVAAAHNHRWALSQLMRQGVDVAGVCDADTLAGGVGDATFEIVHIIYHPAADQIADSDAEFSRPSIAERRAAGLADMRQALAPSAALARPRGMPPRRGATVRTLRSASSSLPLAA
jgi:NTE family protein